MQTPKLFGPEKEQRLDAVKELLKGAEAKLKDLKKKPRPGPGEFEYSSDLTDDAQKIMTAIATLKAEEEQLETLEDFSEGFDRKYRPILEIAGEFTKVMPVPLAESLTPLIEGFLDIFERLDRTHLRYRKLIARQRRNAYQAYVEAGFSPDEAIRLVESEARASTPIDTLRNNVKIDLKP